MASLANFLAKLLCGDIKTSFIKSQVTISVILEMRVSPLLVLQRIAPISIMTPGYDSRSPKNFLINGLNRKFLITVLLLNRAMHPPPLLPCFNGDDWVMIRQRVGTQVVLVIQTHKHSKLSSFLLSAQLLSLILTTDILN